MSSEPGDRDHEPRANLSGEHIRRLRRKQGLTLASVQAALSQEYHLVLDRTSLGRMERGKQTITDQEFGALRDLLGASESEVLWGKASTTSEERKKALRDVKQRYTKPSSHKKKVGDMAKKASKIKGTTRPSSGA